ncbi:MAG: serine hydrolase domain-containing protein, partial [Ilumatobacter sp.]
MIVVVDSTGDAVAGSAGGDAAGNAPTAGDVFRIGSITKVFTALTTLSLVEEGLVDLDASATDYVTRVPVDADITVRDLLGHRSGIDNYTDVAGFFETVIAESERVWEPEEQVELVVDRPALFEPGEQFSYSNTNYIILGILIEEVTGQPYHDVVRERILDPLEMSSTYLAGFEEGAEPFDPFVEEPDTGYDYTSIATSAWSAGAMVSSAEDLHTLFTALFDERVLSGATVDELTASSFYGLGVELDQWQDGLIGHSGSIPGYHTFVRYSTESG